MAATTLAKRKSAAQEETAAAFEESPRVLTAAELGLAELREELEQAEKARDKAQRDSHRSQTANERPSARRIRLGSG